jgi:DNA-binding NarL/FixJ family response regulator
MRSVVQVISSHPVFATSLLEVLGQNLSLRRLISFRPCSWVTTDSRAPALFLLDLCGPGPQPNLLCQLLRRKHPNSKFVCLISPQQAQDEYMLNLFFAGVEGIVCLRQRWAAELCSAVRDVLNGHLSIPPVVLQNYAKQTNSLLEADNGLNKLLTAREVQVAHLTLRQFSTRAIAGELGISERTVKFHVANIFVKTGAHNRDQLITIVSQHKRRSDSDPSSDALVVSRGALLNSVDQRAFAARACDRLNSGSVCL